MVGTMDMERIEAKAVAEPVSSNTHIEMANRSIILPNSDRHCPETSNMKFVLSSGERRPDGDMKSWGRGVASDRESSNDMESADMGSASEDCADEDFDGMDWTGGIFVSELIVAMFPE